MAKQVDRLPGVAGRTPTDAYPWDQWLDPDLGPWHLTRGKDYQVDTCAMRTYAYRAAAERGLAVSTVRDPGNGGITIHARKANPR
jgi:hypothetical protein